MRYAELFDGTVLEFPDQTPDEVITRVAQEETAKRRPPPAPPSTERSGKEAFTDIGAALVAGAGRALAFPGQAISLLPGLRGVGETIAKPGESLAEVGEGLKSQGLKVREALRSQAISDAEKDGLLSEFATAIKETIKDPALISTFITEQIPNLLPPMAAARVVGKIGMGAAKGLTGEAAEKAVTQAQRRAVGAAIGTGAVMQSSDIGSEAYRRAYEAAVAQGKTPEEAEAEANSAARIAAGGAFGTSLVAQRLPGARAIEQRLAKVPGTSGRLAGGLGEATSETLEEAGGQLFQNIGVRTVDPTQSLTQGVGAAAGLGLLGGGFFGTLLSKKAAPEPLPGQLPGETLEQSISRLVSQREQLKEPPVPKDIISDEDVIRLAGTLNDQGQPIGYGLLTQYEERLKQLPESPEQQRALEVASSVKERLNIESIQRQQNAYSNIITYKDMKDLGFSETDPLYESLVGKNLGIPDEATQVLSALNNELGKEIPSERRELVGVMLESAQSFLDQVPGSAFYAERKPRADLRGDGAGAEVSGQRRQPAPEEPLPSEAAGLAVPESGVGQPDARETEEQRPLRFETSAGQVDLRESGDPVDNSGPILYASPEDVQKIRQDIQDPKNTYQVGYAQSFETGDMFTPVTSLAEIPAGAPAYVATVQRATGNIINSYPASTIPEAGSIPVQKRYKPGLSTINIGQPITRVLTDKDIVTPKMLEELGIKKQSAVAKRILGKEVKSPEVKRELSKRSLREEVAPEEEKAAPEVAAEAEEPSPKEQIDAINRQLESLMKRLLNQYGLKDIEVKIVKDLQAKGEFSGRLIKLADDTDNPLLDLKHEAVHALKELGFFTRGQWETLKNRASQEWIQIYLKDAPYTDTVSRYDAYKSMFEAEGKSPQEVEEALIEEAIADAFSFYAKTRPPSGLLSAINTRLKNLFKALKEFLNLSQLSAEDIFGKIEKGQFKPILKPTEAVVEGEEPAKPSLRQVRDIFNRAENIPEPPGVESIRQQWIGGVSGVGDRDSMYDLYRVNGSKKYIKDVQNFIRKELGDDFKGYRLMSNDELEELQTGSMGTQYASFTLNPDVARAFKNIPAYANKTGMSVVEMNLTPEHIEMIGHPGELELVVNYGQGYNPSDVKVVEKYSLRQAPAEASLRDTPKIDRERSLNNKRISPRFPTAVKATEDVLAAIRLQPDLATFKRDPDAFRYNIGLMSKYPNFTDIKGTPNQKAEQIINRLKDNLLWLYNSWDTNLRDRSKLWYVGGNRIAHRWAQKYGIPPETAAAIIASLSPQKDWFQNVSLAERTLDAIVFNADFRWDAAMDRVFKERAWTKKFPVKQYRGKTLKEMYVPGDPKSLAKMAVWIRAWDEGHNPQTARVITPEGTFTNEIASGKTGAPIAMRAQSFAAMVKTLQIMQDSNLENFSNLIGKNHKVRSFYNNIIAPFAGDDVTIDTHAVAAALMRPLGSSDLEVYHNFGSAKPAKKDKEGNILVTAGKGTKNSAVTGLYGTYAIYAEAYRRAAQEVGVFPREMQSITWEAIRGLFRPEQKQARLKSQVDALWNKVAKGEINAEDARQQISKLVSGIEDPAWVKSPAGSNESRTDSSYATELPGDRVPGREPERLPGGARERVARVRPEPKLSLRSDPPAAKEAMALVRKARAYKPEEGEPAVAFPLLFHSGTGDPQDIATYIEPRFGSWVSEVLSGSAEEDVDVDNFVPLSYYSSAPTWVRMQTARKLNKTLAEVTDQDVKNSGQLAVVYNVDDQFGDPVNNVYQIGKDGYNGGYTDVLDVYGNQKKLYETDLEEEGDYRSEAKTLFGVEPGDIVSKELITPDMVLVGDALIDFLNQYESEFPAQDRKGSKFSLRSPDTKAFKQWFGDSKVVDANGNPLVVYHGTNADIAVFDSTKQDPRDAGFWFANEPIYANQYAAGRRGGNVMPAYLSIKNPKIYYDRSVPLTPKLIQELKKQGYDGVVRDFSSGPEAWRYADNQKEYAAFESTQIKSAIGNVGTFDISSPDIRRSLRVPKQNLRSQIPAATLTRMDATVAFREERTFPQRIMDAISPRSFSWFREQAINRYEYLAKLDRAYVAKMGGVKLLADQSAEAAALMSDLGAGLSASAFGVHDRVGGIPVFRNGVVKISNENNTVKGPLAIFAPLAKYGDPEIYRLFEFVVTVKRGSRFSAQGKPTPFQPGDLTKARALETQFPEFVTIQKEWTKYNDGLVKFMRDTGVITPAAAAEWTQHGDYFPMYKYFEGDEVTGPKVFSSIANVSVPKKYKGDNQPLGDFFENVVRNTQAAIQAGIKNVAAQRATKVALSVGEVVPLATKPKKMTPEVYRVLENGQEKYYAAQDMMMISALKSLNIPDLPFIGFFAGPANLLRNLVTKTPDFMAANMLRDSVAAWVSSGKNITPVISTLINFGKAIGEKSPELNALRNAGILGGYDYAQGVQSTAETFAKDLRKIGGGRTAMEKLTSPATSLWGALEKGSAASDAATRMEIYKKVLAETGNEAEALFQALEVMNFNRKGKSGVIRVLTAAVPFLNARIQGLDVLYRAGIRPLFAGDATAQEKARAKTFWIRGSSLMALSAMYWAMTHDDDEYKRQEQEVRDNYWLLPSMGVKIPIPFEIGVMFKVLPERVMEYSMGDDTGQDFARAMGRHLRSTFAFNPIPQTIVPIVEATTNKSFFTGRPILGQGMEDIAPQFQATPTTSKTATELANFYNSIISFLPAPVAKELQASPVILEHLIQGYTGTMGMYAMQTMDYIVSANSEVPNASKRFEQMPVIKRFLVDPQARGTVTAFYDMKNAVDQMTRTANYLERTMNFEDQTKFVQDNIKVLATKEYVSDLEKTMKEFRDQKLMIRSSTMDAETKRSMLDMVEQMELQLTANIRTLRKQLSQ